MAENNFACVVQSNGECKLSDSDTVVQLQTCYLLNVLDNLVKHSLSY